MRRYLPALAPVGLVCLWTILLAVRPMPAVVDWRIVVIVVTVGAGTAALLAAPLIDSRYREWGLGAGILSLLLAPLGGSVTVLSLFTYEHGDLSVGWAESWSVLPSLIIQVVSLVAVGAGLALQRSDRDEASHRTGRMLALIATLVAVTAVAAHLYAIAFDVG